MIRNGVKIKSFLARYSLVGAIILAFLSLSAIPTFSANWPTINRTQSPIISIPRIIKPKLPKSIITRFPIRTIPTLSPTITPTPTFTPTPTQIPPLTATLNLSSNEVNGGDLITFTVVANNPLENCSFFVNNSLIPIPINKNIVSGNICYLTQDTYSYCNCNVCPLPGSSIKKSVKAQVRDEYNQIIETPTEKFTVQC